MTWWNSFSQWLTSDQGSRVLTDAVLPFIAIIVAGVLAALIARGMSKRVLELHESESKSAAVASIIAVARKATVWHGLDLAERARAEHLGDEASVRLRLLPIAGAGLAAAWSDHEVETIKRNSATFSFQAEQSFNDLRDRLVDWQAKPGRARKLFRADLDRWRLEEESAQKQSGASSGTTGGPDAGSGAGAGTGTGARTGSLDDERVRVPAQVSPAEAPVSPAAPERVTPPEPAARFAPPSAASVVNPTEPSADSPAVSSPAEAPATEGPAAEARAAVTPVALAPANQTPVAALAVEPASPAAASPSATATAVPERRSTGMVSTPVVQPPYPAAPASPSDAADREAGDSGDHDPAYSAPVSAHNVRRRTSPDA